jgi:OFA family oxalate/formate antiporter-like MFS transporter
MEISTPLTPARRWTILVYGFFVMLFLGLIYAWSIFITPLEDTFGWVRSETALIFTISISFFCIGGITAGMLLKKTSFRNTLYVSAAFILIGFLSATRIHTLLGIYLTYGVLCGFGVGLGYNATLGMSARWFPDKLGFSSGALLMGFGFGGLILGTAATYMIASIGWQGTFIVFGVLSAVLVALSTHIVNENPPESVPALTAEKTGQVNKAVIDLDYRQMLGQPSFWLYSLFTIFLGASGLAIFGNAVPIAQELGMSLTLASTMVGLISITNGASRILFGSAFDLLGRRKTMTIDAVIAVLAMALLIAALSIPSLPLLFSGFILIGLAYGGLPPISATFINSTYGPKNFPVNFSIVNLNIIPAALLGPALAGMVQVASGSYLKAFYVLFVLCLLGGTSGYLIKK